MLWNDVNDVVNQTNKGTNSKKKTFKKTKTSLIVSILLKTVSDHKVFTKLGVSE